MRVKVLYAVTERTVVLDVDAEQYELATRGAIPWLSGMTATGWSQHVNLAHVATLERAES